MLITYEQLKQLPDNTFNLIIEDLTETINTSENYDFTLSRDEVINNLNSGYFEIELHDSQLEIFCILMGFKLTEDDVKNLRGVCSNG